MGRTGPPLQTDQDSIRALGTTFSEPVVSTLGRASTMLKVPLGRLEDAVDAAGLAPWGEAASGAAVYRWPELLEAAAAVGVQVPKARPTLAAYQQRRQAKRDAAKGNDVTGRPGQAQLMSGPQRRREGRFQADAGGIPTPLCPGRRSPFPRR